MMQRRYVWAMDALYLACVAVAGAAIVIMTLIIPYGVFMRYVMNSAASWPEPLAVLMMILFTFVGGAACLRANVHIAVELFVGALPMAAARAVRGVVTALLIVLSIFMVYWGFLLVQATWHQVLAEFTFLRTGIAYLPVPVGGLITLLFIFERLWVGEPGQDSIIHREPRA
jgi:TRAP-type C4-dicarboxylate transport system permease small subunit